MTRQKIAWRIIPFVLLLYIVSYLDRANLSFARSRMVEDLKFSEAVFGLGVGIFFAGYIALEIPGALIAERWSARKWLARILVSWGICSSAMAFVHTPSQFYIARFLLGLAEAGFVPAVIVYLSHWFAGRDRARAMSGFIVAIPISMLIGAPISAFLLDYNWTTWTGWRWMFLLEGLPAVVLGFVTLFYLKDHPRDVRWLNDDEKRWIENRLEEEKAAKRLQHGTSTWVGLRNKNVLILCAALFFAVVGTYGFIFWLPKLIDGFSGGDGNANLWTSLPYGAALLAVIAVAWSSDRRNERRWHTIIPLILCGFFLMLSTLPSQPFALRMLWLTLTGSCLYAWGPSFWSMPTLILGESAAAASIGLINMIGNLGGFIAGLVVGKLHANGFSFPTIMQMLSVCFAVSAVCCMALQPNPSSDSSAASANPGP